YSGDANFLTSTSAALTQNVLAAATILLSAAPNPTFFGQPVVFIASVTATPPASGTPTGTVTFLEGNTTLGTGTLGPGAVATCPTMGLSTGVHSITARYGGDSTFAPITSTPVSQTVNPSATTTTLTSSPNPSTAGQLVTFMAVVTSTQAGGGVPTGVV